MPRVVKGTEEAGVEEVVEKFDREEYRKRTWFRQPRVQQFKSKRRRMTSMQAFVTASIMMRGSHPGRVVLHPVPAPTRGHPARLSVCQPDRAPDSLSTGLPLHNHYHQESSFPIFTRNTKRSIYKSTCARRSSARIIPRQNSPGGDAVSVLFLVICVGFVRRIGAGRVAELPLVGVQVRTSNK